MFAMALWYHYGTDAMFVDLSVASTRQYVRRSVYRAGGYLGMLAYGYLDGLSCGSLSMAAIEGSLMSSTPYHDSAADSVCPHLESILCL